jgi:hypothetical protein
VRTVGPVADVLGNGFFAAVDGDAKGGLRHSIPISVCSIVAPNGVGPGSVVTDSARTSPRARPTFYRLDGFVGPHSIL